MFSVKASYTRFILFNHIYYLSWHECVFVDQCGCAAPHFARTEHRHRNRDRDSALVLSHEVNIIPFLASFLPWAPNQIDDNRCTFKVIY